MQNNTKEKDSTIQQAYTNNLLGILESIDNIDISGQERQQVDRVIKSLQDLLEQVKSEAHESEQQFRARIRELTDEKESLLQRLSEAGAKNIEQQLLIHQLQEKVADLAVQKTSSEQEQVVLLAQLAEYRETLQELAGYEFLQLRFD
mmetsp:Transcript_889/g.1327  ORF Transcript_889/g.1327 Transcript_889/m.1327 type:complete len:147 (-) Transcript_889:1863-2303(-)